MKYLIFICLIVFLSFPVVTSADFVAGWSATSTTQSWIFPTKINGVYPTITIPNLISTSTATSIFNGQVEIANFATGFGLVVKDDTIEIQNPTPTFQLTDTTASEDDFILQSNASQIFLSNLDDAGATYFTAGATHAITIGDTLVPSVTVTAVGNNILTITDDSLLVSGNNPSNSEVEIALDANTGFWSDGDDLIYLVVGGITFGRFWETTTDTIAFNPVQNSINFSVGTSATTTAFQINDTAATENAYLGLPLIIGVTSTSTNSGGFSSTGLSSNAGLTISGGSILDTSTATSTFSGGIVSTGLQSTLGLEVDGLISCNTIDTDASGVFICGTDEGGVGGAVDSVSNSDGSLTISPTTGAVVASLNVDHSNTWTQLQAFASTTSSTGNHIDVDASFDTIAGVDKVAVDILASTKNSPGAGKLYALESQTGLGNTINPQTGMLAAVHALLFGTNVAADSTATDNAALFAEVQMSNTGSQVNEASALQIREYFDNGLSTAEIDDLYGINIDQIDIEDSATVNFYGLYMSTPLVDVTGSLTNSYGLYINEHTNATTINREIFLVGAGEIFFRDDNTRIGSSGSNLLNLTAATTTASDALAVDGQTRLKTTLNGFLKATSGYVQTSSIDISSDTNLAAGRSLTLSGDSIEADNELYNKMANGAITSPVTADSGKLQWKFATAITLTRVSCSTDTGTTTIQFDERVETTPNTAGTDVLSTSLDCDSDAQTTTSFSNATIAADAPLNMDIDSIVSTPGVVRIHIEYELDDV